MIALNSGMIDHGLGLRRALACPESGGGQRMKAVARAQTVSSFMNGMPHERVQ